MMACDLSSCALPTGLANATGQDGQPPLQSLLECPVCHEVAQPPIYTCIGSHHMFCADCRGKVQMCPLCKTTICDQRCLFAEQCMEHMRLPCKNYHEGCKAILKGTEYRTHLNNCPFRPIECFISRCGKKIPFFQYFDHIKEAHRNKVNGIDDCNKHIVEWWIEGDPAATARWPPYYFTCFNQVFLYMAISTVHGMWEWVWIIGNDEDAKRFRVISRVENVEKMAELTWKGAVHSIRKSVHEIVSSGLAFVTNSKELRNPYLFRKSGEGSRYFWRTDVEIVEVESPPPGAMMYLETKEGTKKAAGGKKQIGSIHSTTEAPEIIGNTSGKGFMRQSGPNSLTPSQIINLEEENKNTGSRTASNTNVSVRKQPQTRESNMVGKASLINQEIISVKPPPTFDAMANGGGGHNVNPSNQGPYSSVSSSKGHTQSATPTNNGSGGNRQQQLLQPAEMTSHWSPSHAYADYSGHAPNETPINMTQQQQSNAEKSYQKQSSLGGGNPQQSLWGNFQYDQLPSELLSPRNQTAMMSPKVKTPGIKSPYPLPDSMPTMNGLGGVKLPYELASNQMKSGAMTSASPTGPFAMDNEGGRTPKFQQSPFPMQDQQKGQGGSTKPAISQNLTEKSGAPDSNASLSTNATSGQSIQSDYN